MNLVEEYMRRQGTWEGEYILERTPPDLVGIAFGHLDAEPAHHWDKKDRIHSAIEHWKATGDLKLYQLDFKTMREEEIIEKPSVVRLLTFEKEYLNRRMSCL
ncbi:hypothetical protein P9235_15350 [Bacillus licheniformis]|uniref:hypothetical protein n=1 Tax=Bacillus licheniformis TaxID=1402 RepID=UPI002E1D459B|nr:hypothetical protein [Bacillus licheniformis]MED4371061.1 hypothetical protein [Bacillus licheniformis]